MPDARGLVLIAVPAAVVLLGLYLHRLVERSIREEAADRRRPDHNPGAGPALRLFLVVAAVLVCYFAGAVTAWCLP